MAEITSETLAEYQTQADALLESKKTLLMTTMNADGEPEMSYSPYLRDGQDLYVFISELAAHTQNLMANPQAGVMFIADESVSQNLFARERLIYQCRSEVVEQSALKGVLLNQMQAKFGNIMKMLRSLPDFHLLRLQPYRGRYVVGFGKAFDIDMASGELIHVDKDRLQGK